MKQQSLIYKEIVPLVWAILGFGLVGLYWDGFSDGWGYPTVLGMLGIGLWGVGSWLSDIVIWGKTRRMYVPPSLGVLLLLAMIQLIGGLVGQSWALPPLGLLTLVVWIAFVWVLSAPQSMRQLRSLYWGLEVGVTVSAVYTLAVALGAARVIRPIWNFVGVSQVPETLVGADLGAQVLASAFLLISGVVHMIYVLYDTTIAKKERPLSVLFYLGIGVVNASFLFAFWGQEGAVIPAISVILTLGALAVLYLKPGLMMRNQRLRLPGVFLVVLMTSCAALVVFSGARTVIVAEDTRLSQEVVPVVIQESQDSLLMGRGIGMVEPNMEAVSQGRIREVSNIYLQWFLEIGISGLILVLVAAVMVLRSIWRAYRDNSLYDDPLYISAVLGLFQLALLGIFVSLNIFLVLLSGVYLARILQHSLKDTRLKNLCLARLNPQGQIGLVLGCILLVGLIGWGGLLLGNRVYADMLWNQERSAETNGPESLEALRTILDRNPVHIAAADRYIGLRLRELQDVGDDPALLEQTVTDILGTTQDLVQAYPGWYPVQFLEAQVLLELSSQVLLPSFWFEDRLQALQDIAPESAQTVVTEARFILVRSAAAEQNAQLYQGLNPNEGEQEEPDVATGFAGQLDRVESLLESAAKKNPALPEIWIARVLYLEQEGRSEEVPGVLEEYVSFVAENQIPADPELVLLLVQELIDTEQFAQAESYLQQVQRAYPHLQSTQQLEERLRSARGELE